MRYCFGVVKINRSIFLPLIYWGIVGMPGSLGAWEPGKYPASPQRMATGGFSVNTNDRNDVIAFWHAIYQASEGYETRVNWTGNYTGNNGATSPAFVNDVQRRLNYFRAMCGLNSDSVVNSSATVVTTTSDTFQPDPSTLKSTACQNAALMLVRNYNAGTGVDLALTHDPAPNLIGWSASAWNASSHGNFAFGIYGPGAITEYMVEELSSSTTTSTWNSLVGHRRWCLFPGSTDFATGDQPGTTAYVPPTNVLYVIPKSSELLDTSAQGFVTYPSAGFFPADINSRYWSISRKGADFTFATVKMRDADGHNVPVINVQRNNSYGNPAIIWEACPAAAARSVTADTNFTVTISGVAGPGMPISYHYSVTLINPEQILSDQELTGPASFASDRNSTYSFTPPTGAEGLQVVAFRKNSSPWKEDAESPKTHAVVVHGTAINYSLIVKPSTFTGFGNVAGISAFHLTFPTSYDAIVRGVPEQVFELDRNVVANAHATINFEYRRGYMTRTSNLAVETSPDDGVTWNPLGDPIKGVSDTQYDLTVSSASLPLPESAGSVRIRFRYFTTGGSIYTQEAAPTFPTGIFLDEITTSHCDLLEQTKVNTLSPRATKFMFKSKTAGAALTPDTQWQLKLRTKLGGKWFSYGPGKAVTVTAP